MIKKFFVNPDDNRLRAGWRVLLFLLAIPIVSRILMVIIKPLFGSILENDAISWLFRGIVVVIAATLVVWLFRKYFDKKSLTSLGLRFNGRALLDIVVGFVLSGIMAGIIFVILLQFKFLEIQRICWSGTGISPILEVFLWFLGVGATVAWSEELGFRGYILQNLGEGFGIVWAVVVSCILYGLIHMSNPNSTLLSGVLIALIGYLRIFGWLRTGQLWLSMGMHAGWNFFQGPIFGFGVSGFGSQGLIRHTLSGPKWITGGPFGPEAGVIVVPVVLLALVVMFLWTLKRADTPWVRHKRKAA